MPALLFNENPSSLVPWIYNFLEHHVTGALTATPTRSRSTAQHVQVFSSSLHDQEKVVSTIEDLVRKTSQSQPESILGSSGIVCT